MRTEPAHAKLSGCIRLARQCSRDSWQAPSKAHRAEYRRLSREAMADARYWKKEISA